jgi:capsular polysaccharide biosynthesis protein
MDTDNWTKYTHLRSAVKFIRSGTVDTKRQTAISPRDILMGLSNLSESQSSPSQPNWQAGSTIADEGSRGQGRRLVAVLLLIVVPMIAAAAALMTALLMTPYYAAQAEFVFDLGERGEIGEQYLATQAVVAKSRAVLEPTALVFTRRYEDIEDKFDTSFLRSSTVLRMQFTDPDRAEALAVLKDIVRNYSALLNGNAVFKRNPIPLVAPFVIDDPVWPEPFQAAAIGAAIGLAFAIAGLALFRHVRGEL